VEGVYDKSFRSSITAHGTGGQPFRYKQERDLFGFFSNAHSVFDAFCFALFAIGALRDSANFPLATDPDERNVTWSKMLRAYGKAFPSERRTMRDSPLFGGMLSADVASSWAFGFLRL
jgi:hypothetical protein